MNKHSIVNKIKNIFPKAVFLLGIGVSIAVFSSPAKAGAATNIVFNVGVTNPSGDTRILQTPLASTDVRFSISGGNLTSPLTQSIQSDPNCFSVAGGGTSWNFTYLSSCAKKLLAGTYTVSYALGETFLPPTTPTNHLYTSGVGGDYYTSSHPGWIYNPATNGNNMQFSFTASDASVFVGGSYFYQFLQININTDDRSSPGYHLPANAVVQQTDSNFSYDSTNYKYPFTYGGYDVAGNYFFSLPYNEGSHSLGATNPLPGYPWFRSDLFSLGASLDASITGSTTSSLTTFKIIRTPYNRAGASIRYVYTDKWENTSATSGGKVFADTGNPPNINVDVPVGGGPVDLKWTAYGTENPATILCTQGGSSSGTQSSGLTAWKSSSKPPVGGTFSGTFNPGEKATLMCPRKNGMTLAPATLTYNFVYVSPPPPPVCTPPTQTRTQACPAGQIGSITQTNTANCPCSTGWCGWVTTQSTCQVPPPPPCTPLSPQTQTLACPAGQPGQITQSRSSTCPGPTWGSWMTTQDTCTDGNLILNGNNKIQAAVFCEGNALATTGANNMDLIGSYLAKGFNFDAASNTRFHYDFNLGNHWPPGFRFFNMPVASER